MATDPWLSTLQRRDTQLTQLDEALAVVAEAALSDLLAQLWTAVLGERVALVAASVPPTTDGLDAAAERSWTGALTRWVKPVLLAAYARQYAEQEGVGAPSVAVQESWWAVALSRLSLAAQRIVEDIRGTVAANPTDSIDALRDKVARVLQMDTVTRRFRDQIATVEAELFNQSLPAADRERLLSRRVMLQVRLFQAQAARARSRAFQALAAIAPPDQQGHLRDLARQTARSAGDESGVRRDLSVVDDQLYRNPDLTPAQHSVLAARRAYLYRKAHADAETWRASARRIARTESTGVLNAATLQRGLDQAQETGEEFVKRWISAHDERTRPTHRAADGQIVPLEQAFRVGEAHLSAPGDPTGPVEEVINCRCALTILTRDENDEIAATLAASAEETPTVTVNVADTPAVQTELPIGWRGVLAPLDTLSGDRRMLRTPAGELRLRQPPLPVLWQPALSVGHEGSVVVGSISHAWIENGQVLGYGPFDLGSPDGQEAARQLHEGHTNGISVDMDDTTFEYDENDDLLTFTDWRIMGATYVPQPAFDEARITPVYASDLDLTLVASLTAAAAEPRTGTVSDVSVLDRADFDAPVFAMPTPLTVTREGRVFGHLAQWGVCHVGIGNACVTAPHSVTGYAHFHVGSQPLSDGSILPVGKITLGGGHADPKLGYIPATEHYDNASTAVAVVRATEDQYGIAVAGRVLPGTSQDTLGLLRLCPLSGDWRAVGGNLELVAALSVNTPGFPIPHALAASAGGLQTSLIAAGVVPPRPMEETVAVEVRAAIRREDAAKKLARRVGLDPKSRAAALAARVIPENRGGQ